MLKEISEAAFSLCLPPIERFVFLWYQDGALCTLTHGGWGGAPTACSSMLTRTHMYGDVNIITIRVLFRYHSYCELLERLKLFTERARVISLSECEEIQDLSTDSTSIPLSCGSCQKPITTGPAWHCSEKCKGLTNTCSICHLPVKGQYAWCQGCGHGGHIEHMRDWFATNKSCPTGCGHNCEWNV